jgi:TPR repeat protein
MHRKYEFWNETFVDEDTHEEVELLRSNIVEGSTFKKDEGEEERLIKMVMEQKHHLSAEELTKLCFEIDDNKELLLEQIKKGDEEAAIFIDDPVILQELCDKGNKTAAEHMGYKYAYGDEANGIFVDYVKAAEYMKLASEEFDANDYQEKADPHDFEYSLRGDAGTLGAIRTTIDNLCQRFGTPGNELGMFVPLGPVMQKLVGSPHYEGNILSMEQPNPDCLILKTEANSGAPLLYALRQAFANLDVEVKETKW